MTELKSNKLENWLVSVRAFSFPASVMPVIFGTVLAAVKGGAELKIAVFILALLAMIILHSGANLLNDYFDYKKGIDVDVSPVSGGILKGIHSPRKTLIAACIFLTAGDLLGLVIVWLTNINILYIGLAGAAIGIFYSLDSIFGLKYNALGDFSVFFSFGTLGTLGAWMVQTGTFSWLPVIWSLPMSLLVIAILHANNWRDIKSDGEGNIVTVAIFLGQRGSFVYYSLLVLMPFAIILFLIVLSYSSRMNDFGMPLSFFLVFLALPGALSLLKKARNRSENIMDFVALDGFTAKFNTVFGLLCVAALLVNPLLECL